VIECCLTCILDTDFSLIYLTYFEIIQAYKQYSIRDYDRTKGKLNSADVYMLLYHIVIHCYHIEHGATLRSMPLSVQGATLRSMPLSVQGGVGVFHLKWTVLWNIMSEVS